MIEIDGWIFVQMVNFFILLFILNRILYKPVLENIEKRKQTISGHLAEAQAMEQTRKELLTQVDRDMAEAKIRARKLFEDLRNVGLTRQKALIFEGEQAVHEMNEHMLTQLHEETQKAKEVIKDMTKVFGDEIVNKMISPS
ncbi:MAG TPA: ATP synthase F0 subunit B [Thermodesulfovibrionia bacterium]|nr:ATP synthase F0 subunit B [Thermodesulfovibrionia bacterium]